MIIKGKAAQNVKFWSKHLLRDDTNEKAILKETRGVLAQELEAALEEMRDVAGGSRCGKNFLYQANINPRANEKLTLEQWKHAIDTLEKNLGFEDHQRVIVEHIKEGRQHYHVIWSRVNPDTLRVTDIGGDRYTMRRTANQLERELGLSHTAPTYAARDRDHQPEKRLELWEIDRAAKTKIDPHVMKEQLTELWKENVTGRDFMRAVEERGYILARGDRRDFVIVDHAGGAHSLARRLEGVKAKDVRDKLADIDRDRLPSVQEARQSQRDRFPHKDKAFDKDAAQNAWRERVQRSRAEREARAAPVDLGRPALTVVNSVTGVSGKLVDFVFALLSGPREPPIRPAKYSLSGAQKPRLPIWPNAAPVAKG